MIIDGDMQCFPAGELRASATFSIATHHNLPKAGHAFDVEVQQVPGRGVFITHRGWSWMQIAPATQTGAPQDTAHRGGAESGGLGDLVSRAILPAQFDDAGGEERRNTARAMPRTRGAVQQARRAFDAISVDPFGDRFRRDVEAGRGPLQRHPSQHLLHQRFSTTQSKSGILVNVHSISPRSGLLSTISFSGSGRMDNLLKDHRYPATPPGSLELAPSRTRILITDTHEPPTHSHLSHSIALPSTLGRSCGLAGRPRLSPPHPPPTHA